EMMTNGPDLDVDGFHRAKSTLDIAEVLVVAYGAFGGELALGHAGANDIDPVERRLLRDAVSVECKTECVVGDVRADMFCDLVLVDDLADAYADCGFASKPSAFDHPRDFL